MRNGAVVEDMRDLRPSRELFPLGQVACPAVLHSASHVYMLCSGSVRNEHARQGKMIDDGERGVTLSFSRSACLNAIIC
jgi:hypothetical protein